MSRQSRYSFPPTPQDWIHIQDPVRTYYVNQKLPLKEVRNVLRDRHGFRATDRMIKARLKQWGYLKNAKKEDWHFLALLHQRRRELGKSATLFDVRGHRKNVKDLQRFIRNQNMTVDQFLEEARETADAKEIPDYIQALTPDNRNYQDSPPDDAGPDDYTPSPPQLNADLPQYQSTPNQKHYLRTDRPTNHQRLRSPSASSNDPMADGTGISRQAIRQSTNPQDSAYMSASSVSPTCSQMQMEFDILSAQITRPAPLLSRFGDEDISSWALLSNSPNDSENSSHSSQSVQFVCSRCNQPSDRHFVSLDNFEPHQAVRRDILNGDDHTLHLPVSTKEEGSWLWVSRCFLACMCLTKGDVAAAEQSLREAAKEFERLLERKDQQLLTAAGLVITILHMHSQGEIARRVIQATNEVCERNLSPDNAIRMTIRYLTASATISQTKEGITSDYMNIICRKFLDYLPPEHGYVIAARYNYAWMLKFEGKLQEAEKEAREVYTLSRQMLGQIHMQSITCLAVIAGCLGPNEERRDECISIFQQVINYAGQSLGQHHPYTLEAKRRMADLIVGQSGRSVETLKLYEEVLFGRVHMLGASHSFTLGAKEQYEEELQTMNLWIEYNGAPSVYQRGVEELFSPNSPGAWARISRRRRRSSSQSIKDRLLNAGFDENDMRDDDDDIVLVDERITGSQSPRSTGQHEFKAY